MKIIYKDGHVDECPQDQELHVIRHTAAHVMAQAIKRLYPEADFAFGPATENGFYYDVDLGDTKLTDEDLANIEKKRCARSPKENLAIKPFILPRDEAVKLMEERHENYKIEHMADLADETEFSFFQQGEYIDMCIGPHLTYTKAPEGLQDHPAVRRLLEERQREQDADPHQRRSFPQSGGAGSLGRSSSRRPASAITARSARRWACS